MNNDFANKFERYTLDFLHTENVNQYMALSRFKLARFMEAGHKLLHMPEDDEVKALRARFETVADTYLRYLREETETRKQGHALLRRMSPRLFLRDSATARDMGRLVRRINRLPTS